MSEPSPEAKQAAEAKGYRQDKGYEYGAFVEGYDTATAKARDQENNTIQFELDNPLPSDFRAKPSAPTAETERKEGDESCQADFTSTALSSVAPKGSTPAAATTADVEKIAREAAHELHLQAYILEPSDNGLVNILSKYFAQACAPLVEALRRVRLVLWQDAAYPYDGKVIRDLDAALHRQQTKTISPKARGMGP